MSLNNSISSLANIRVDVNIHTENVPCPIKQNSFFCFAFIHNVTLRVNWFQGKMSTYVVQNAFAKHPHVTMRWPDALANFTPSEVYLRIHVHLN